MIKHIVMFKLLPQAQGRTAAENAALALSMLEQFPAQIPTLREFRAVVNAPDAPADNCELALIHPAHKNFGAFISQVRASRACIDYEA